MSQSSHSDRRAFMGTVVGAAAAGAVIPGAGVHANIRGRQPESDDISQIGKTEHTRFAINLEMWFRGKPFLDRIRASAALGFDAVEFWPWRNKDLDGIIEVCAETGVEVMQFTGWGFSPGLNNPKNHAKFVEEVTAGCKAANKINAPMMTIVGGNDQQGMTQAEMHDHIITGLKMVAPIAEDHDVMLILEPMNIRVDHKGHCLYGSPDAVRICREVDSTHVKINWDLYHMQITEGDLCGRMRDGFDQIGYLQLADHPGRNEPGTGEINYSRVLKQAWDLGYRKAVGVECNPSGPEVEAARRLVAADVW